MIQKTSGLLIAVFVLAVTAFGQIGDAVAVIPHWKNNETHLVKIKSTTTDNNNGKERNYFSTFDAKFIVRAVSDSDYKVEWIYTNSKLAENEPVIENQILAKLISTKLLIKLSAAGRFVTLLNVDEVKASANKVIDELIANSAANPTMNTQYKAAKLLIASKLGLEIALLKQVKFYNFSFGFTYRLNLFRPIILSSPTRLEDNLSKLWKKFS